MGRKHARATGGGYCNPPRENPHDHRVPHGHSGGVHSLRRRPLLRRVQIGSGIRLGSVSRNVPRSRTVLTTFIRREKPAGAAGPERHHQQGLSLPAEDTAEHAHQVHSLRPEFFDVPDDRRGRPHLRGWNVRATRARRYVQRTVTEAGEFLVRPLFDVSALLFRSPRLGRRADGIHRHANNLREAAHARAGPEQQ